MCCITMATRYNGYLQGLKVTLSEFEEGQVSQEGQVKSLGGPYSKKLQTCVPLHDTYAYQMSSTSSWSKGLKFS